MPQKLLLTPYESRADSLWTSMTKSCPCGRSTAVVKTHWVTHARGAESSNSWSKVQRFDALLAAARGLPG
jgi:hypothetical protein